MFPDLKIAQNYSQLKTKVKYNIQFGTTPYVKEILINDVNWQPFSFKFDKTTTRQVNKRYDTYSVSFKSVEIDHHLILMVFIL